MGPDEITVYNPGQVQASWAETQEDSPWECFSIHISPETAAAVTGGDPVEAHRSAVGGPGLAGALRRAAIAKDAQEAEQITLWVVGEVLRLSREGAGAPPALASDPAPSVLAPVLQQMRDDLASPVRVPELAAAVSLSPDHFIRAFVKAMGVTPYAWHLQLRLREGRRRLKAGHRPGVVAAELGFSDQAHFHRHFRAAYAQTPGQLQRQRP
ncbi:helix-turn-helix domain-containing protein [Nesterenkonia sphaerica]|uniref:Helix-turn-helix transcriptional regulator n=1 Tax=Nesterenkonia sphaerica TaxID=1804988 RepID=A0A5R9A6T6_9MICC|nr:AraC family transcriptional regulator [Nesterenkonia sphaerica]TLP74432.1 helix-turn-helix transcriptional regulator [Nesterenkonia sphaerica]